MRTPLQAERVEQLRQLSDQEVSRIVESIRHATTIPRLPYHFEKHGRGLGIATAEEYLQASREHLRRRDLRIFTYLRPAGRVPFWELMAPDIGTTVMYNEQRRQIWSFFRPEDAAARMAAVQAGWIEVVRTATGWDFREHWQWDR